MDQRQIPQIPSQPAADFYLDLFQPVAKGLAAIILDIPVQAVGKPRMTGSDAWRKRPCITRYYEWKDRFTELTSVLLADIPLPQVIEVSWVAVFEVPPSYSKAKRVVIEGSRHHQKPDRDNIDKAILDTLFKDDSRISDGSLHKRYCRAGEQPRIILRLCFPLQYAPADLL